MNKKTVRDIDVLGKRVLLRVDFNVPLDPQTGAIADDTRIRVALPTVSYLCDNRARVVLCSHLGRPTNKDQALTLAPVAQRLSQLLDQEVKMAPDCVGPEVEEMVSTLDEGGVLMLENLRFHPEEEKNDPAFAQALAKLADVFVNDAFGTAHRAHASTVGVTRYLPAVAGFLIEKELEIMDKALNKPDRPFTALIGGAKISDKMGVLENILDKVDSLLIGGGMGTTFLKSLKYETGESLVEEEKVGLAQKLIDKAMEKGVHLLLPSDVVVANKFDAEAKFRTVSIKNVPHGWYLMDIGPETIKQFAAKLRKSKTVIWNGPVGVFEFPNFRKGTQALAEVIADLDANTVIGGGSTAEAVQELGLVHKMTHVSTGGGASLKFLEGKPLPGVDALLDKQE
ncbi:MAG: phosphoglycerate kinase [Chloroflexi bacterium]|nr:MAG: phosphoglycerate kinase [Chloroflexota bacterium]RLC93621.1 MAG: phosphoglycerate kinase [Chloroflexota bacterium]